MAKGLVGTHELQHVPVYRRASTPTLYGKLGFWVKNESLVEVDQALEKLHQLYPGKSLSTLICQSIIAHARSSQRRKQ